MRLRWRFSLRRAAHSAALSVAALAASASLAGAQSAPPTEPADPLSIVWSYETAWNRGDLDAVLSLFAPDARAMVRGSGSETPLVKRDWLHNALMVQWCPNDASCRIETSEIQINGETLTWRQRLFSTSAPDAADPWDGTGEALVRDGKIVLLQLMPSAEWQARRRATEDALARASMMRQIQALPAARATATARATVQVQATETARLQEPRPTDTQQRAEPSRALWASVAVALSLAVGLAVIRRPE